MKIKKMLDTGISHIVLAILSVIWIMPILWVILTSFRGEPGSLHRISGRRVLLLTIILIYLRIHSFILHSGL